jgi:uncharacterized membrane protein
MFAFLAVALLLAGVTYLVSGRLAPRRRIFLAGLVFIVAFGIPAIYISTVDDEPLPGSKVVSPSEVQPK